ncbi:Calx-beta domain-containing protein [Cesiribacter sp. SM1]|uniref:Calx-beta domain-containing protein n=1 Tax=Cesiribacter sp. SM1 TaxID=2861196 RepID=UPI001CD4673C|nr:Calx-beta domain-containing protein [Cesiribacter sp. SM1]
MNFFRLVFLFIATLGLIKTAKAQPGTVDKTFGTRDGFTITPFLDRGSSDFSEIVIQEDGKLVVAGEICTSEICNEESITFDFGVARYNQDGTLDTSFGPNRDGKVLIDFSGRKDNARSLAIQGDGKIVVVGRVEISNGVFDMGVVRLNENGTIDKTFGQNRDGKVVTDIKSGVDWARAVTILEGGEIVVAGEAEVNGNVDFAVVRYRKDGTLDESFGPDKTGKVVTDFGATKDEGKALFIQEDGNIIVAGEVFNHGSSDFGIVRYKPNGALDTGFGGDGIVLTDILGGPDRPLSIAVQRDKKIVIGGRAEYSFRKMDAAVLRYESDGTLDSDFGDNGRLLIDFYKGGHDYGRSVVIQPDGKILISGEAYFQGIAETALARIQPDGTLDETFGPEKTGKVVTDLGGAAEAINAAKIKGGKMYVAGRTMVGSAITAFVGAYHLYELGEISITEVKNAREDNEHGYFELKTTKALNEDAVISFEILPASTATEGTDYESLNRKVTLKAGQLTAKIEIKVKADAVVEGDEEVVLALTGIKSEEAKLDETKKQAALKIIDDDEASLSVSTEHNAAEPDDNGLFVIESSHELDEDLTISFTLSEGTAIEGKDYKSVNRQVELKKGSKQTEVLIDVEDDSEHEGDETVTLTLDVSTKEGVKLDEANKTAELTITDDEKKEAAVLSVNWAEHATEPDQNGRFVINVTRALDENLVISFRLRGTATEKDDYKQHSMQVTLEKGKTTAEVIIEVEDDKEVEEDETVIITLEAPDRNDVVLQENNKSATLLIKDNDKAVLSVAVTKHAAEDERYGIFSISTTAPVSRPVTISYSVEGTATPGKDYQVLKGEVVLPAKAMEIAVEVVIIPDTEVDPAETVTLILEQADYSLVQVVEGAGKQAEMVIEDNDKDEPTALLWVEKGKDAREDDEDGYFVIRASEALTSDISISIGLSGNAQAGKDYTAPSQPIVFPAGKTSVEVRIAVRKDEQVEVTETVELELKSLSGSGNISIDKARASASINIQDNDACFTLSQQVQPASCADGTDGGIVLTLGGASDDVVYSWSTGYTGKDLQKVAPGKYKVEVTDRVKGCTLSGEWEVKAQDKTDPVVKVRTLSLQLNPEGKATINAQDLDDGSTDNCAIKSITADKTSFSCADVGENTVTLTVEDESGNKATASVNVLIEDKLAPALTANQKFTVAEDVPVGTKAGTVKAADNCGIKEWKITAGNAADHFHIDADGNILTNAQLDYEDQALYRLTIEVSDGALTDQKEVTIEVGNVSDIGPEVSQLIVAAQEVLEDEEYSFDVPLEAFVSDGGEVLRFSVEGQPAWFTFDAATRHCGGTPLNEHVGEHQITIKVTDSKGRTAEQQYKLIVINTNDAPHALDLSAELLMENLPEGVLAGALSHQDVDAGDSHSYSLVAGEGDTHNSYFTIEDNRLLSLQVVDYETEPVLYVRLAVTDKAGATFERTFEIEVGNEEDGAAFLPNLFSPNGDQVNDSFLLHTRKLGALQLRIYNLNGRLVYTTNNFEEATIRGWDGRANGEAQPEGSYLWVLDAHYPDGSPVLIGGKTTGNVTLVR